MVSYFRTMEILQAERQHSHQGHHSMGSGATSVSSHISCTFRKPSTNAQQNQAESMFKVDFFEFYTLLERYITDCLSLLGFSVSAAAPLNNVNALRYIVNPELHKTRPLALHAFHANLLEALDDENCPLHTSLGIHEVRVQLGIAKDFRNAWKDADTSAKRDAPDDDPRNIRLEDLQLEVMLRAIIRGCDQAHSIVQAHTHTTSNGNVLTSRDFEDQPYSHRSMDVADMPFEYMDDAMDLD